MTRNLTFFFAAFLFSMPIWWSLDLFAHDTENFFLAQQLKHNPQILKASAAQANLHARLESAYPLAAKHAKPLELQSTAAFSLLVKEDGGEKVLFEKQGRQPLLIASLTKLMTALIAIQSYSPSQEVRVTPEAVAEQGEAGLLEAGQTFSVKDLLYIMLMESSNDAAVALGAPLGREAFIAAMNNQTQKLKLFETSFQNPTGLDILANQRNHSSAADLAKLASYLYEEHPQVFDILSQQELPVYTADGAFHHTMKNTNLLLDYRDWPTAILGGKTGFTPLAQETLVLLVESPDKKGYIVNVLVGSQDRFGEMRTLLQWTLHAYQWSLTP